MIRAKYIGLFTLAILLSVGCVKAQSETECDIAAFVADPNSGVNVRSGDGIGNSVLKTIPRDPKGTLVFFKGSKGDWLKISRAVSSKRQTVFSGTGWVHAPLLAVKTRGTADELIMYYRNPRTETEELGSIRPGLEVLVQGCSEDWLRVLIPRRGTEGIKAWLPFGSFCGSPWEDCD